MIDERSPDGIGWARFSDDRRMRYRLARALTEKTGLSWMRNGMSRGTQTIVSRVVFVMLNPSTADAFKLDPTVQKCCKFAARWGADVLEVVNLFAMRSPYPADLLKWAAGDRGDDALNDDEILEACNGASRVIAAWGNHGELDNRHETIREQLARFEITLHHLGLTGGGFPLHPLARGKSFIPLDREPVVWA